MVLSLELRYLVALCRRILRDISKFDLELHNDLTMVSSIIVILGGIRIIAIIRLAYSVADLPTFQRKLNINLGCYGCRSPNTRAELRLLCKSSGSDPYGKRINHSNIACQPNLGSADV